MDFENEYEINFSAQSINEAFSRLVVSMFLLPYDPPSAVVSDIKTAVSEAVTNCIIHGYDNNGGIVKIHCGISDNNLYIKIEDSGKGIENINQAMEPLYTSKPEEERSGLGFTVMESFMDSVKVESETGKGTSVFMTKKLLG